MTYALITSVFASFFLCSCNEQIPPGLNITNGYKTADSSYIAPIESKQEKVVLIEKLTGVSCANCPKAARIIEGLIADHPSQILSVAMFPPSGMDFTEPIFGKSRFDFRNAKVDEIVTILGAYSGLPNASLDRRTENGQIFGLPYATWVTRVTPWLSEKTPVNIHVESAYVVDKNEATVTVKIAFTETVSTDLYLTVYIIENNIEDYQADGDEKILYNHEHVFRDCITSVSGSSLNYANKNAGTVLQKQISFSPVISGTNAWNLDNCKVIAFVHKSGTDQEVLHAQEVHLK